MKARFKISPQSRQNIRVASRSDVRSHRPSLTKASIQTPERSSLHDETNSVHTSCLEDEIAAPELEVFAHFLMTLGEDQKPKEWAAQGLLPSYADILSDFRIAYHEKKSHQKLTKKLIQSAEPVINNATVAEKHKQALLDVTGRAIENLMQLKLRVSNIRKRLAFIDQSLPKYVMNYAQCLGYSTHRCSELEKRAADALGQ